MILLLHFDVIVSTVEFTVLLISDCLLDDGVVAVYPLGSLLDEVPEKLKMLLNFLSVNGGT
jgi:hypothetical protein